MDNVNGNQCRTESHFSLLLHALGGCAGSNSLTRLVHVNRIIHACLAAGAPHCRPEPWVKVSAYSRSIRRCLLQSADESSQNGICILLTTQLFAVQIQGCDLSVDDGRSSCLSHHAVLLFPFKAAIEKTRVASLLVAFLVKLCFAEQPVTAPQRCLNSERAL
jgi:hypothetical protein